MDLWGTGGNDGRTNLKPFLLMASNATSTAVHVLSLNTTVGLIYERLSVSDLLGLALVCSAVYKAIRDWFPVGYNINNHLQRFFDEPLSFRLLQAQTGTLISGSNALQFFERRYFPGSDLNLYVPCKHTSAVAAYLLRNCYRFVPSEKQEDTIPQDAIMDYLIAFSSRTTTERGEDSWGEIEGIFEFVHMLEVDQKVQIVCSSPGITPFSLMVRFHSTLVMNCIGWDKAYSFFPAATFLRQVGIMIQKPENQLPGMSKYWGRGYKFSPYSSFPILPSERRLFPIGERYIGDRHSWVIPLATNELEALPAFSSIDPLSIEVQRMPSGFFMGEVEGSPQADVYTPPTIPLMAIVQIKSSIALQHSYTLPRTDEFKKIRSFAIACQKLGVNQLGKLQEMKRADTKAVSDMNLDKIPPRFWDEEIIFMIKEAFGKLEGESAGPPTFQHERLGA